MSMTNICKQLINETVLNHEFVKLKSYFQIDFTIIVIYKLHPSTPTGLIVVWHFQFISSFPQRSNVSTDAFGVIIYKYASLERTSTGRC